MSRPGVLQELMWSSQRFAYTVATVLLSVLVRQLKLHQLEDALMEVRSELVSTPREETWITFSPRK